MSEGLMEDGGTGEIAAPPAVEVGDASSSEAAVSPDTQAPAEVPSEAASPTWAPSREEWEETQGALAMLARLEQERYQAQPGQEAPDWNLDPIENENFTTDLRSFLEQTVQSAMAPFVPAIQGVQIERAEAQVDEMLGSLDGIDGYEKDNPEHQGLVKQMSGAMIDQVKSELGLPLDQPGGPKVAQAALRKAAENLAAFSKTEREAGKQAYIDSLRTVAEAGGTPSAGGAGTEVGAEAENESEAIERWLARKSL